MQSYLNPEILSRIEGLALRARLIVEGYVSGVHRSPFHGFSIEFAEHRNTRRATICATWTGRCSGERTSSI